MNNPLEYWVLAWNPIWKPTWTEFTWFVIFMCFPSFLLAQHFHMGLLNFNIKNPNLNGTLKNRLDHVWSPQMTSGEANGQGPSHIRGCKLLMWDWAFGALLSRVSVITDFAFYSFSFTFPFEFVGIIFLCFLTEISWVGGCVGLFYFAWFWSHLPG